MSKKMASVVPMILIFTTCFVMGQNKTKTMTLTYDDGTTQTVTLNRPHQQIVRIDFAGSGTAGVEYVKGFEGIWNSNWGVLTFRVEGLRVVGHYPHDKGRIEAVLSSDGRTMEGQWLEAPSYTPPSDGGRVIFRLSPDGKKITGHWWYGKDREGGDWTGTRQK